MANRPLPQLVALSEGPDLLLDKPIMLLGRHPECDIQLNSRRVSRRHCCIARVNNRLLIRDLGSTNGTRVNGQRVREAWLQSGDELLIGAYRYRVHWPAAAEQVASAAAPAAPAAALGKAAEPLTPAAPAPPADPQPPAAPGSS